MCEEARQPVWLDQHGQGVQDWEMGAERAAVWPCRPLAFTLNEMSVKNV